MSNVCCKEFKGWLKSFTKTEFYLSILQALFLICLVSFLTFLILHLLACFDREKRHEQNGHINETTISTVVTDTSPTVETSLHDEVECTWKPSYKTSALTHYYNNDAGGSEITTVLGETVKNYRTDFGHDEYQTVNDINTFEDVLSPLSMDGIPLNDMNKKVILALVKIKPNYVMFGCTLTIIATHWTLTAASCIESIEEVDSLDSFVMMEGFGENIQGKIHGISDVMIHPQYQSINSSYDLAALKAEESLVEGGIVKIYLPSMLDYFLVTLGEKLTVLGFGKFRNTEVDPRHRGAREAAVFRVPEAQCAVGRPAEAQWSPRHLAGGESLERGACGPRPLCAGAGGAGGAARAGGCGYCAGTPLLRARTLLGVQSENPHCGVACEPALYVNVAMHLDWIDSVVASH